jgi:hypothetical protein
LGQIAFTGTGFCQRTGLRVRQAGVDHEPGAGHVLKGRNSLLATLIASKGVADTAGQKVHLAGLRTASTRCEHADAGRQSCRREHAHELTQRAASPLGDAFA